MNTSSPSETPVVMATSRRTLRLFLAVLALCSALLYLLPFGLVRLPGYARHSKNTVWPSMDYVFGTSHVDADVVILGDSSAMNGLDTVYMSGQLGGTRVINLANMITTLPVIGEPELRHYLSKNRRPKVLVLYGAPWEADFLNQKEGDRFPGEEMLFRHGSFREVTAYMVRHAERSAVFPFSFYSVNSDVLHPHRMPPKTDAMGHLNMPWAILHDDCAIPETFLQQSGAVESMQQLKAKFHDAADHVLYYAAPIPYCRNTRGTLRTPYSQLGARPSLQYPAPWFLDDKYYIHPSPGAGVTAASQDLAEAIAPMLGVQMERH